MTNEKERPPVAVTTEGLNLAPTTTKEPSMSKDSALSPYGTVQPAGLMDMAVDLLNTASLAVALVAAFAIKYVTAAVTQ